MASSACKRGELLEVGRSGTGCPQHGIPDKEELNRGRETQETGLQTMASSFCCSACESREVDILYVPIKIKKI